MYHKTTVALMCSFLFGVIAVLEDPWYTNINLAMGGVAGAMLGFALVSAIFVTPVWGIMLGLNRTGWRYRAPWKTMFVNTWLVMAIFAAIVKIILVLTQELR